MSVSWHRAVGGNRRWSKVRAVVLERDPICRHCGRRPATHADHLDPVSKGGDPLDVSRIVGSCSTCNLSRGNRATPGQPLAAAPSPSRVW